MNPFEEFKGKIGRTHKESIPWWPEPKGLGKDYPNIIVILLDDTGFSQFGCYGSTIETPNFNRLAENGLKYTSFHATPLCSPTRACLLTGRNPHSVGMRSVANFDSGYPHMTGEITPHAATIAEILREEGYTTFAVGKWHLTKHDKGSAAGYNTNREDLLQLLRRGEIQHCPCRTTSQAGACCRYRSPYLCVSDGRGTFRGRLRSTGCRGCNIFTGPGE